jgi:hypothetical protein
MRLGVYLLRPPQHGRTLLANAQMHWLRSPEAVADGWHMLPDVITAQAEANGGTLVMAVFENPNLTKPGHIAIVCPGLITPGALAQDGPMITQAGGHNALAVARWPRVSVTTPAMDSGRWRCRSVRTIIAAAGGSNRGRDQVGAYAGPTAAVCASVEGRRRGIRVSLQWRPGWLRQFVGECAVLVSEVSAGPGGLA